MQLKNKNMVVIGGSRGVGRAIVEAAQAEGACVLAVGRRADSLAQLSDELPGARTLQADATNEDTPGKVFEAMMPDVLVLCGGAIPPMGPVQDLSWEEFSMNWNNDVKSSFEFCRAALRLPLRPGSTVVLISSGAAIGGSGASGGYAGAKKMQMFMADYCQAESKRGNLGLRFVSLAPMRIMRDTDLGKVAIEGYAHWLGMSEADFIARMEDAAPTPEDVVRAVVDFAVSAHTKEGTSFGVSSSGVAPLS